MNGALIKVAMFVRDLLTYDESLIKIGRQGDDITDFTIGYIAIDTLGQSQRMATGETHNGTTEIMTYSEQWSVPVTLSFYGDGSWQQANDFSTLLRSQKSLELQESLSVAIHKASGLTDVKMLTGQQYGERYELTLNIQYSTSVNVETLNIETAETELITN